MSVSWLTHDDSVSVGMITPDGYCFNHVPRSGRRGGGVSVLYETALQITIARFQRPQSFECFQTRLTSDNQTYRFVLVYRPPNADCERFFDELTQLLDDININFPSDKLILLGDVNFHLDVPLHPVTKNVLAILNQYSLIQHVTYAHQRSHP